VNVTARMIWRCAGEDQPRGRDHEPAARHDDVPARPRPLLPQHGHAHRQGAGVLGRRHHEGPEEAVPVMELRGDRMRGARLFRAQGPCYNCRVTPLAAAITLGIDGLSAAALPPFAARLLRERHPH
jgi:hypothetical protein